MKKLLVKNIGLLATPEGRSAHRGEEQGKIKFLKNAWVLIEDGTIASVGTGAVPAVEGAEVVDAEGHLVTPGLVDAHTHLIFGGWRQNELGLKLHGASYLDIQNAGGGIQSTTNATRQASEQELAAKASKALDEMMGFGTTTVEAKSGYGLATEHELKALEVIKDLNDHHRMDLVATFMGAHLVPAEYKSNREELIEDGTIASVGTGAVPAVEGAEVVDAEGHLVTPGLVDAHTHLIFGGWRQNELGLKLHGASYLDIQNAGGGIQSTTNATRQASEQELAAKASKALDEMMGFGTTTVEAKSGYGLATEHELKALEVIKDLNDHHRMDLVATFMGAHLVPAEYKSNREEYVRLVCEEMMPKVKEQGIAKFCDVFCEADTFTVEESRQVLEAGLKYGLRPKIHADEIEAIGGSQLAGEIGAISAEHLIVCPPEGIASMAKGGVIACLLPATSFNLGAVFAPARDMVKAGVPVAMATDFNPGSCPCLNMQFVINLGCLKYKLTPEEVLTAVTLNGAAAIDLADKVGSVEEGKMGDLVIWDAPDLDYICYRVGSNLAKTVIKRGEIV